MVSALTSAVAYLYRNQNHLYEARITQLEDEVSKLAAASEECQESHTLTKVELANLKGRMEALESVHS